MDATYMADMMRLAQAMGSAVFAGNVEECLILQTQLNGIIRSLGQPAIDYPAEYFRLQHEAITKSMAGDEEGAGECTKRTEEMVRKAMTEAGLNFEQLVSERRPFEFPPEYKELQDLAIAAFEKGDMEAAQRLSDRANQFLFEKTGVMNIVNVIE